MFLAGWYISFQRCFPPSLLVQFFGSLSVALPRSAKRKANFGPQIFTEKDIGAWRRKVGHQRGRLGELYPNKKMSSCDFIVLFDWISSGWWLSPTPLKNDGVRQFGLWNSQYMESHKIPWFQTTNQMVYVTGLECSWGLFFGWERPGNTIALEKASGRFNMAMESTMYRWFLH